MWRIVQNYLITLNMHRSEFTEEEEDDKEEEK